MSATNPVLKSEGVNESERRLISISNKTFLNLWSYPNVFVKKDTKNGNNNKEIADLLVVCGHDVIVFSDKTIKFADGDVNQAWARWYRKAIEHSARQLRKAERCIRAYPNSLFLDAKCTQPLPIELPKTDRRMHGVVIVSGVDQACRAHFPGGTGSMMINSDLKGDQHINTSAHGYTPFAVGDVNDGGSFLHVFNDATINILFDELTTVTDFINYMQERETLLRSGKWISACGEEDLLGLFLDTADDNGVHSFSKDPRTNKNSFCSLMVEEGYWSSHVFSKRYFDQREMDRKSYAWDRLIETFGRHALAGTSYRIPNVDQTVAAAEQSLRTMALEPRVWRRHLTEQLFEALDKAEKQGVNKFFRVSFPAKSINSAKKAYVFFVLGFSDEMTREHGQEAYRQVRLTLLRSYCLNLLLEYSHLEEVVGLGFDSKRHLFANSGGSEDVVYAEQQVWTEELRSKLMAERLNLEIFQKGNMERGKYTRSLYPKIGKKNRHERRKEKSLFKKERR